MSHPLRIQFPAAHISRHESQNIMAEKPDFGKRGFQGEATGISGSISRGHPRQERTVPSAWLRTVGRGGKCGKYGSRGIRDKAGGGGKWAEGEEKSGEEARIIFSEAPP